jgi:hypothetical protein
MKITQLGKRFIGAQIITGTNAGEKVYMPRIIMPPTESPWPFLLKRRQYPISICFAMTINKSQGKSLNKVDVYHLRTSMLKSKIHNIRSNSYFNYGFSTMNRQKHHTLGIP